MDGPRQPEAFGRYRVHTAIAAGGMATVHLGRLSGVAGFSKTVAIKRLHPHFAKDPEFVAMFLDEARLAARIQHPNVVSTLDIVSDERELLLVMEYVAGGSLASLIRAAASRGERIPPRIVVAILCGVLNGLHAAHEARDLEGAPLSIVHRDVSPQNILVGSDGVARVVDFGIAKASGRLQTTREGQVKGKFSYMAPEQLRLRPVDRRADVYATSVVAWEALTGKRLFDEDEAGAVALRVMRGTKEPPSKHAPDLPEALDRVILAGLSRKAEGRHMTAQDMAAALEDAVAPASVLDVSAYVERTLARELAERRRMIETIESDERAAPSLTLLETGATTVVDAPAFETSITATVPRRTASRTSPLIWLGVAAAVAASGVAGFTLSRSTAAGDRAPSDAPPASDTTAAPKAASPEPELDPARAERVTAASAAPAASSAIVASGVSTFGAKPPVARPAAAPPRPAAPAKTSTSLDFNKIDRR